MTSATERHEPSSDKHQKTAPKQRFNPPSNPIAALLWRWMMWWYVALPFSMMEPWEIVLVSCLMLVMVAFFLFGVYKYLPQHALFIWRRAGFYLYGPDAY